jgi:ABC-type transporter MlaC component
MGIPGLREDVPENTKKEKTELKEKIIEDLRKDPDDTDSLDQAKEDGKITETEKKAIKKAAGKDPFVVGMKHLNIQEMAKRLKNATPEQKEKLYPVFKKKVQNAKKEGTITKDDQQKYYEILEDMR